jgi:hypothetical protein
MNSLTIRRFLGSIHEFLPPSKVKIGFPKTKFNGPPHNSSGIRIGALGYHGWFLKI